MNSCPILRYDRGETQRLLQHLHTCKSAYNGQPAAGHTGYVQTLVRFVVVVVQVKPRGMQEKLVSFSTLPMRAARMEWMWGEREDSCTVIGS